jgi:hypothetical protein
MKDIVVVDYVDSFGPIGTELDENTQKSDRYDYSYNEAAKRLRKIAIRNMRVLLRKTKIKRICQN